MGGNCIKVPHVAEVKIRECDLCPSCSTFYNRLHLQKFDIKQKEVILHHLRVLEINLPSGVSDSTSCRPSNQLSTEQLVEVLFI